MTALPVEIWTRQKCFIFLTCSDQKRAKYFPAAQSQKDVQEIQYFPGLRLKVLIYNAALNIMDSARTTSRHCQSAFSFKQVHYFSSVVGMCCCRCVFESKSLDQRREFSAPPRAHRIPQSSEPRTTAELLPTEVSRWVLAAALTEFASLERVPQTAGSSRNLEGEKY